MNMFNENALLTQQISIPTGSLIQCLEVLDCFYQSENRAD
jgi:hypothetical protein